MCYVSLVITGVMLEEFQGFVYPRPHDLMSIHVVR
jgi:hypothetical protein